MHSPNSVFVEKGKQDIRQFIRETRGSDKHCAVVISVVGKKMLINDTRGDVGAVIWRKSATLLDSDYFDMVCSRQMSHKWR